MTTDQCECCGFNVPVTQIRRQLDDSGRINNDETVTWNLCEICRSTMIGTAVGYRWENYQLYRTMAQVVHIMLKHINSSRGLKN